eukprot:TRINITY_DN13246_c0_g1_i1.p1 TRINITY_DN13246_c0_g1~~TRINITY_DN13246_c0_g1_i1.p1  ORF type:complete len:170 (+),score=31.63 TRINITY_DN13246_c0_g1_i1:35-544(+)
MSDKSDNKLPYTWNQTLKEVTITIKLNKTVRSRDLDIKFTKTHLDVKYKNSSESIVKGEFHKPIKPDASMWSLDNGTDVILELQKSNDSEWWSCVLKGDPEIDTTKIEPENSKLSDLDGETRALVEKMMFDQAQKAQGKPTSDEMQKKEMLDKFMKQHPEMDFSNAKIG